LTENKKAEEKLCVALCNLYGRVKRVVDETVPPLSPAQSEKITTNILKVAEQEIKTAIKKPPRDSGETLLV
jgi:hypothetical protein